MIARNCRASKSVLFYFFEINATLSGSSRHMWWKGSSTSTEDVHEGGFLSMNPWHFPKPKSNQKKTNCVVVGGCRHALQFFGTSPNLHSSVLLLRSRRDVSKIAWAAAGSDQQKRPIILHDVSQITMRKLNELVVEVLLHPPYSPCANRLPPFSALSAFLAGRTFASQNHTKATFLDALSWIFDS